MIKIRRIQVIAVMVLFNVAALQSCKNTSTSSKSRLRNDTVVTVNASFRVVNNRMKINAIQGKAKFKDVKMSFAESHSNPIDLKKISSTTGELLLTSAEKLNITAKISNETLKDAECEAKDIPIKTTAVTASFSCTNTPEDGVVIKKYPPNITDAAERKVFDQLAVECKKSSTNLLVVDADDKEIVYGCYCSKIDRQLLFQSYKANMVNSFVEGCEGKLPSVATLLTPSLIAACNTANKNQPTPTPSGTPGPTKISDSCQCLSLNEGGTASIKYADFYGVNLPLDAFVKKFNRMCVSI